MALLFNVTPLFSLSSAPSSATGFNDRPFVRLCNSSIALQPNSSFVGCVKQAPLVLNNRGGSLVVRASADVDGTGSASPSDNKEESVPVEKLPMESNLDQKMRMKMAKKIRLRRKRLVRKRHLRKKGRWPPSKLKKNKNV